MYSDHYGLTGHPFQLTPDARFWFESRTHRKAMAYLGFGLAQGEGFVIITGEVGAGKSTLVAHLMANIDRSRLEAISLVSTQVDGDDMLRLVAQGLGLNTAGLDKARLLTAVEKRLGEVTASGKRVLLIVDEAQALSVSALEELRMLSNFQNGPKALIQIVLLGQPEFRNHLARGELEQLRQRVIATHHLDAMGADEVEAYLGHRLQLVGWKGRPDFSAGAIQALHRHSDGVPRRLNQLAHRLMLQAAIDGSDLIEEQAVENVAAELNGDRASPEPAEAVLPLRASKPPLAVAAVEAEPEVRTVTVTDPALERRISVLESQLVEQEAVLRRVLTLLVDWVEAGNSETVYRSNAA
jgi:general secretion pathway protein A